MAHLQKIQRAIGSRWVLVTCLLPDELEALRTKSGGGPVLVDPHQQANISDQKRGSLEW